MDLTNLVNEYKECIRESRRHDRNNNFERALQYKLKEINLLGLIPEEHFDGKFPKEMNIARGYRTAAKFARNLEKKEENLRYLIKSAAYFWKAYEKNKIWGVKEFEDMVFVFSILKGIYKKGHTVTKELEDREKEATSELMIKWNSNPPE